MPLDLRLASSNPRLPAAGTVTIEETLLWELPGRLDVRVPLWERVGEHAMDVPSLLPAEVASFEAEIRLLRDRLRAVRQQEAIAARKVTARDPQVRQRLAAALVDARDPEIRVLDELVALCELATSARCGIVGHSD